MAERILFIGAGASYGARLNQTKQPPLGTQLCQWLRVVSPRFLKEIGLIDLHSEIQVAIDLLNKHPNEDNYEVLMSRLDRDDRATLNRLLLITFSDISERRKYGDLSSFDEGFRNQQDTYDRLLNTLNFKDKSWSVVSLNYDLLFEEAMRRNSISFFYPHFRFNYKEDQSGLPGVKIYKPHGSINFFTHGDYKISHGEPSSSDDHGEPAGFFQDSKGDVTVTFPIVMAAPPGAENVLHIANSSSISEPVIANYTKGMRGFIWSTNFEVEAERVFHIHTPIGKLGATPCL